MEVLIYIAIGLFAGVSGGLFGIGGGVVIVPAMVYFAKMGQQKAQGTSLAALIFPIGLLGVYEYWKNDAVDLKAAALIAGGFLFGALGGAKIALALNELTMRRIFAGFLVLLAVQLVTKK